MSALSGRKPARVQHRHQPAFFKPVFRITALAAAAMAFPQLAMAQTGSETASGDASATDMETVIVQASPFKHSAEQIVQATNTLSGEELEKRRHGTIGDVLAETPGIGNASFGPGVGRPVIRGQGGPRVQIMSNGIGSMDASSISPDHAVAVDPLGADQIEVIKGPATLIYGGSASAGVVNVVDDRLPTTISPGLRVRGDVSYGDNGDELNTAARARYGSGQFQFGALYSKRDAGNFSIPGYAARAGLEDGHDHEGEEPEPYGVLQNSSLTTENIGASAAWVVSRGMLGAAVTHLTSDYGISGHSHEHDEEVEQGITPLYEGVRIDLNQTRVDLRGVLYDPLPGFERLESRVGINDYTHHEIEPSGDVGTTFNVQEVEGRIELAHRPIAGWAGIAGVQLKHREFEAIGDEAFVPPVITNDTGVFLIEDYKIGPHHLELGGRVDFVSHRPDQLDTPDIDFTPYSLSAGANFVLSEHVHLRVNAQSTQRAPAAEELYAFGPHIATTAFERGQRTLDPETNNGLDIGLSRDSGRWTWDASAFYNHTNDYIYLKEVDQGLNADGSGSGGSDGVADRVNEAGEFASDGELLLLDFGRTNAEFYGGELSSRFKLLDNGPYKLSFRGFGDMVRARQSNGDNLPRITPMRLGVSADGSYGPYTASLGYTRVMKQDKTATLETSTPGYDLLTADLGYTLTLAGTQLTLYARGRNLLDEKQRLSTSFLKDISPQPGRSLFVGLRFDFGQAS